MENYKDLYYQLYAATADAIEALNRAEYAQARTILIQAQRAAENEYLSWEES